MSTLSVDAIRPKSVMASDALKEARSRDKAWLLNKKASFCQVACPACGGSGLSQRLEKDGFTFGRCAECKTLYMPFRPNAELLAEYYAQSANMEYFSKVIFPASQKERIEHIYTPRLEMLLTKCAQAGCLGGTYAEIGAGSGQFAHLVQKRGAFDRVLAVEPAKSLAADCRARGLDVLEAPVEQLDSTLQVNVVAIFEVLEHLFSPASFVRHAREILAEGGLCILTTPNGLGLDVLELGMASTTVDFQHLTLFNPDSITRLMQKEGFEVIEVTTPGKLDVSLVRQGWDDGAVPSGAFLEHMLRESPESVAGEFQKFVSNNLLSSHMWVVAQKK
ncbi:class I SAM-dependent methyltransferase [Deltaproteobacteria bacterium OttesenSCG-928-M10]|nr:class I SAM-dependent methyltransferase [Deltaproteobacteria bacterium OttesenSCG-928-M10]